MDNYAQNYFKAVQNPLPQLKKVFEVELNFLKSFITKESKVVDFGCGIGRPARDLALYVKEINAFDNDDKVLEKAREYCKGINNILIENRNAFHTNYPDNNFDLVYATYNLIGSINKEDRLKLVKEMVRIGKLDSKIVNITWLDNNITTEFLKKYYPTIGIDVISINEHETVTSKGVFGRIAREELLKYYKQAKLRDIYFKELNPVWLAIIGTKHSIS